MQNRYKLGKQHKLSPMFGMGPGFGQDIMFAPGFLCSLLSINFFSLLSIIGSNENIEGLFFHHCRYGEQAAQVTSEGLDAAGHAIGTAWAVFKIRRAFNPKSILKPTNLAKAAAESDSSALKSKYKK